MDTNSTPSESTIKIDSLPRFNGKQEEWTNYQPRIEAVLTAKGLETCYNYKVPDPDLPARDGEWSDTEDKAKRQKKAVEKQTKGVAYMTMSLDDKDGALLDLIHACKTAEFPKGLCYSIFQMLDQMYNIRDATARQEALAKLAELKLKKKDNPEMYFIKIMGLYNRYRAEGHLTEQDLMDNVLTVAPRLYHEVINELQRNESNGILQYRTAFSKRFRIEQLQRKATDAGSSSDDSSSKNDGIEKALVNYDEARDPKKDLFCLNCKTPGHRSYDCPIMKKYRSKMQAHRYNRNGTYRNQQWINKSGARSRKHCSICDKPNHTANECWSNKANNKKNNGRYFNKNNNNEQANLAITDEVQLSTVNEQPLLNFYDTDSSSNSSDSECKILAVSPNSQVTCSTLDSETINNLNTCQITNNHFDNNPAASKKCCNGRSTPIIYNGKRTYREDIFIPIKKNEMDIEECHNDNNNFKNEKCPSSTMEPDDDAIKIDDYSNRFVDEVAPPYKINRPNFKSNDKYKAKQLESIYDNEVAEESSYDSINKGKNGQANDPGEVANYYAGGNLPQWNYPHHYGKKLRTNSTPCFQSTVTNNFPSPEQIIDVYGHYGPPLTYYQMDERTRQEMYELERRNAELWNEVERGRIDYDVLLGDNNYLKNEIARLYDKSLYYNNKLKFMRNRVKKLENEMKELMEKYGNENNNNESEDEDDLIEAEENEQENIGEAILISTNAHENEKNINLPDNDNFSINSRISVMSWEAESPLINNEEFDPNDLLQGEVLANIFTEGEYSLANIHYEEPPADPTEEPADIPDQYNNEATSEANNRVPVAVPVQFQQGEQDTIGTTQDNVKVEGPHREVFMVSEADLPAVIAALNALDDAFGIDIYDEDTATYDSDTVTENSNHNKDEDERTSLYPESVRHETSLTEAMDEMDDGSWSDEDDNDEENTNYFYYNRLNERLATEEVGAVCTDGMSEAYRDTEEDLNDL